MSWCKFVFRCPHLCWEAQLNLWAPRMWIPGVAVDFVTHVKHRFPQMPKSTPIIQHYMITVWSLLGFPSWAICLIDQAHVVSRPVVSLHTSQQSLKNMYLSSHPVLAWYTGCVSLTTRETSMYMCICFQLSLVTYSRRHLESISILWFTMQCGGFHCVASM